MKPIHMRFGGYQPPASVHNKAAQVLGQALEARQGDTVLFELGGNMIASGHQAADLLAMVESGAMTMCYFSASYLAARVPEFAVLDMPFEIMDLTDAERALSVAAVAPVIDEQRRRFGDELCRYVEPEPRFDQGRGQRCHSACMHRARVKAKLCAWRSTQRREVCNRSRPSLLVPGRCRRGFSGWPDKSYKPLPWRIRVAGRHGGQHQQAP
jgi:hypothetical protein